jgi:uncharacterized repeat protein (TIGR01451 family)
LRSVPGWVFPGDGSVYNADEDASVVVPAQDNYTTRIRDMNAQGNPGDDMTSFWGLTVGGQELGSGHPGDDYVQYGLHVEVVEQATNGSYAKIRIWNSMYEVEATADYGADGGGAEMQHIVPGETATATIHFRNVGSPLTETLVIVNLPGNMEYVPGTVSEGWMPVNTSNPEELAHQIALHGLDGVNAVDDVHAFVHMTDSWTTGVELPALSFEYTAGAEGPATGSYYVFANGGEVVVSHNLPPFEVGMNRLFMPMYMK